ncbi:poly-gamma-glutamate synthase PgsB [Candidatus Saccharibacteria bacterium]|nr:poly-gamma-glutamate synthase PgsB [Candidatus Saccharibacteria bacterium]
MLTLIITILLISIYVAINIIVARKHRKTLLKSFEHRIHVNGIRGKSSVTRLISAAYRESGVKTVAKTTGTAAKIFVSHGSDWDIDRNEANITEQKRLLNRYMKTGYKAFVFECMAINPVYQKYLEDKIMLSTIGVITNVREDHTDQLGSTIPEIAKSLCNTVPYNGHLITAESNPEALQAMAKACIDRNSQLHKVSDEKITDKTMKPFGHHEYKENVAIALKAAEIAGITNKTALTGMYQALPDPGAFKLQEHKVREQTIYWANLFAVNDRESFIKTVNELSFKVSGAPKRAIILNNRHDRPERVKQFVDIALNSISVDYIITFGDYEKQVSQTVSSSPTKNKPAVIHLGNSTEYRSASGELLWEKILESIDDTSCLLVGAVNVHTLQAENLLNANGGALSYVR